jgi:AraC-like DNA-binding protein
MLRALAQAFACLGVTPEKVLAYWGMDAEHRGGVHVPASRVTSVLSHLATRTQCQTLGLALAQAVPLGSFGVLDEAVWCSGDLRDALERASLFYRLVTHDVSLVLAERDGLAFLVIDTPWSRGDMSILVDFVIALTLERMRAVTDPSPRVRSVRLRHASTHKEVYETYFATSVLFNQPLDEIVIEAPDLALPLQTENCSFGVKGKIEQIDARPNDQLDAGDPLLMEVRGAILDALRQGEVKTSWIARELGVGRRTLQRRLRSQGTSIRELLDRTRCDRAVELLGREDYSIARVAEELGFARVQAFYRAFRRWTGTTPVAVRASSHPPALSIDEACA